MINYTFRPLRWDRETTPADERRSRYTFKANWSDTLRRLRHELEHLDADHVVIEADFREADIRIDGMPRGNARQPIHPGIRIAFDSRYGALVYATDAHEFWQHNVRAIALALEALRSVDRYGVTKRAEQYTGWKAIGSGTPMGTGMTRDQAAEFIAEHALGLLGRPVYPAGQIRDDQVSRLAAYRLAARQLHPDAGGATEGFQQLQRARDTLEAAR